MMRMAQVSSDQLLVGRNTKTRFVAGHDDGRLLVYSLTSGKGREV